MTSARAILAATDHVPGLMTQQQYIALCKLAAQFDGGNVLEIGCFHGRSALVMALAAPLAHIVTMSPDIEQVEAARQIVSGHNVEVIKARSWEFLKSDGREWDMVFVDGDHRHVELDMPWFNRVRVGGLILFHDYTPLGAIGRPHVEVYDAVNELGRRLERAPDVLIVNRAKIGMAGFYRREGEAW